MSAVTLLCFSMEEHNQKERLEQELRFLKESYEAEVISREEFEKGKDRIEKKLKELAAPAHTSHESNEETELKQPDKKEENLQDGQLSSVNEAKPEIYDKKDFAEEKKPISQKENRIFKFAVVFVVLTLAAFFSYSLFAGSGDQPVNDKEPKFTAACHSDADCIKDKIQGICSSPGTKDAKCGFAEAKRIKIIVLNDREGCFNCDTKRILGILESWFGPLDAEEIDYGTKNGTEFAESIEARMIPSYAVYGNISNDPEFEKFKRAFVIKGDAYVLSEDAAASTLYFRRESIPNELGLFAKKGDSATVKVQNNLKEFLEAFPNASFNVYYAEDQLTKELGIKAFPTFLVNNRVRFSGIHTAETIKDNFCALNKVEECDKQLSMSLV